MRTLARFKKVTAITPIENSDFLEVAHIGGWQCVVSKGDFKPDQTCIYFEIDSALPVDNPAFDFLKDRCLKTWKLPDGQIYDQCYRIKTIKLRGQLSQGLLMPVTAFPNLKAQTDEELTDELKVRHYDEVGEQAEQATGKRCPLVTDAMGNFPTQYCPKSDQERIQNLTQLFDDPEYRNVAYEVTEKLDGTSATYIYDNRLDGVFAVCSRNLRLKYNPDNIYWKMAEKYKIMEGLKQLSDLLGFGVAIQGEIVGPGINANRLRLTDYSLNVFEMYDTETCQPMDPIFRRNACEFSLFVPHVPVVNEKLTVFQEFPNVDALLAYADGKSMRNDVPREGLVFKPYLPNRMHFKAVSNKYLLKES